MWYDNEYLHKIAQAVIRHKNTSGKEPMVVFNCDGRAKAYANRNFNDYFVIRIMEDPILPFMGFHTELDPKQQEEYIVKDRYE